MTTLDYVPFVYSTTDCSIAAASYSDATAIRVSLESLAKTKNHLPHDPKIWIDACVDVLHHGSLEALEPNFKSYIQQFPGCEDIANPVFHEKPVKGTVQAFVNSILGACLKTKPAWISVPQLPLVNHTGRNKINKMLAEETHSWRTRNRFLGKLVLPVIFTHQKQINKKTERTKRIKSIMSCFTAAGSDGIWVVDSSLSDQDGSGTFDERFPSLRCLHEEINEELPDDTLTICGPYWGMNLVIWARGEAKYPAVSLGGVYKYSIPGLRLNTGRVRVALKPLRRYATADPQLGAWIDDTISKLSAEDPVRSEFITVKSEYSKAIAQNSGKQQIATFYQSWAAKFSSLPPEGRALALYQDLSSAYVVGKGLGSLPPVEKTARRPERVAQQLMMNCL